MVQRTAVPQTSALSAGSLKRLEIIQALFSFNPRPRVRPLMTVYNVRQIRHQPQRLIAVRASTSSIRTAIAPCLRI